MSDLAWMTALTERIEAARRGEAPEADATGVARQVVFQAGSRWYALPLEAVREVVLPRPPFARVPNAPPAVLGAMNLRGRVVAVVDLPALLGCDPEGATAPRPAAQHVVILDRVRGGTGLLVGAVLGVEPVAPGGGAVERLDVDEVEARAAVLFG